MEIIAILKKWGSKKLKRGAGKVAQQVKVLADLLEDLSSVPNTHIRQLTTVCSSRGPDTVFWPLLAPTSTCVHSHTNMHRNES